MILNPNEKYLRIEEYSDRNNPNSIRSVIYYINGEPNKTQRILIKRVYGQDAVKAQREFLAQNGYKALNTDQYAIYDAETHIQRNKPFISGYAKKEDKNPKISNIRSKAEKTRKTIVKFTSLAAATVLAFTLGNYVLNRKKIDYSNIIMERSGKSRITTSVDNNIRNNYPRFENVFTKIVAKDYSDLQTSDVNFLETYLKQLSKASTDNHNNSNSYMMLSENFMDRNSKEYELFSLIEYNYDSINKNNYYHRDSAYDFCAEVCNLMMFKNTAVKQYRNLKYGPSENDLYYFSRLSDLSRLIIYTQLENVVTSINFQYKDLDKPYWWTAKGFNEGKLLEEIEKRINTCVSNLQHEIFDNQTKKAAK